MRSGTEIAAMAQRLEDNIREHGWDASVEAAQSALYWVLGEQRYGRVLERFMGRPDTQRRREWIARGGDPQHWPDEPASQEADNG